MSDLKKVFSFYNRISFFRIICAFSANLPTCTNGAASSIHAGTRVLGDSSTIPAELLRGATLRFAAAAALCVPKMQNQEIRRRLIQPARNPRKSLLNEWTRGELNSTGTDLVRVAPRPLRALKGRKPATVDCNRLSFGVM